jgi:hypothetical protein
VPFLNYPSKTELTAHKAKADFKREKRAREAVEDDALEAANSAVEATGVPEANLTPLLSEFPSPVAIHTSSASSLSSELVESRPLPIITSVPPKVGDFSPSPSSIPAASSEDSAKKSPVSKSVA